MEKKITILGTYTAGQKVLARFYPQDTHAVDLNHRFLLRDKENWELKYAEPILNWISFSTTK